MVLLVVERHLLQQRTQNIWASALVKSAVLRGLHGVTVGTPKRNGQTDALNHAQRVRSGGRACGWYLTTLS